MNEELRMLFANKHNAQAILNLRSERAQTLRNCVHVTPDEIIAADIERRKAYQASLAADMAYENAIVAIVEAA